MNGPGLTNAAAVNLVDARARVDFLTSVLTAEARTSASSFGCTDFTDSAPRLAEAVSGVIGDRRGPFRDQVEQSAVMTRLCDVMYGFLLGTDRGPVNNIMVNNWAMATIEAINRNFPSSR